MKKAGLEIGGLVTLINIPDTGAVKDQPVDAVHVNRKLGRHRCHCK